MTASGEGDERARGATKNQPEYPSLSVGRPDVRTYSAEAGHHIIETERQDWTPTNMVIVCVTVSVLAIAGHAVLDLEYLHRAGQTTLSVSMPILRITRIRTRIAGESATLR